jgi:hypothetical protein
MSSKIAGLKSKLKVSQQSLATSRQESRNTLAKAAAAAVDQQRTVRDKAILATLDLDDTLFDVTSSFYATRGDAPNDCVDFSLPSDYYLLENPHGDRFITCIHPLAAHLRDFYDYTAASALLSISSLPEAESFLNTGAQSSGATTSIMHKINRWLDFVALQASHTAPAAASVREDASDAPVISTATSPPTGVLWRPASPPRPHPFSSSLPR